MSHNQDLSAFDLIVVLLLALGLGALAHFSTVPEKAATPGAHWPQAPSVADRALLNQVQAPVAEAIDEAEESQEAVEVEAAEESWE